jgi:hypothetical protein
VETITKYGVVADRLSRLPLPAVVGVEGFTSSGKSHFADLLAKEVSAVVVHTDEYVTEGDVSLPYRDRVDHIAISSALSGIALRSSLAIVEGICLREVLHRLNIAASAYVYVKVLATNGLWHDGLNLEDFEREAASTRLDEPHRSDFIYHAKWRPHERADIVFERIEQFDEA